MHFKTAALSALLSVATALPAAFDEFSCVDNDVTALNNLSSGAKALQGPVEALNFDNISDTALAVNLNCGAEVGAEFITANEDFVKILTRQSGWLMNSSCASPLVAAVHLLGRDVDQAVPQAVEVTPVCAKDVQELKSGFVEGVEMLRGALAPIGLTDSFQG
ncbi:hypothetical protein BDW74DRAFT_179248 [Aspergillus multicolor]|uniref:uncharacterized protein n=1 Tax=Aspergillus multicolor TaxID=41759 RepID=UPI003CCE416B